MKYAPFERRLTAGLDRDDAPLGEVLRYLRTTDKLFRAFGWQRHPVVHSGYVRWSAPASGSDGYVLAHTYAETACDSPHVISLNAASVEDDEEAQSTEIIMNDLELLVRLVGLHRIGIGVDDLDLLITVIRRTCYRPAG